MASVGNDSSQERVSNSQRNEAIDLDNLLPHIGEFGRYQKLLMWFVCLPACIPCGFAYFNQLFMAGVPDHWCKVPELSMLSPEDRRQLAIPINADHNSSFSKCAQYAVNWTLILSENVIQELLPNESWPTVECTSGWEYNTTEVSSSIVIDFDLVCKHAVYPTIGLSALNVGGPIGVYIFGFLNDRIGRRLSFFTCLTTLLVGGVLSALAPEFWSWTVFRFIVGLTLPAIYQIPFILSLELVGASYRSFVTVMTCLFYTLGMIILTGVAYFIRDWVQFALATSLPFLLWYIYWWFLPESPRWLLARGRVEEALEVLEKLAHINNTQIPENIKLRLKQHMAAKTAQSEECLSNNGPGVLDLCRTPNMRLKTVLITLNWFANATVYVGLSYYGPSLGSNEYLSFLLSAAVEIPSYLACWMVMDKLGRRWPLCICMVLSGISCIATVLLPEDAVNTTLVLYLFSKFTISASFLIIYPYSGELYPTQLRGIGIGTSSYIGGLGLIVIPFITYLGTDMLVMPLIIMGIVSVIGGISGLRLPETLHSRLPETVEEGEEFGKDWTYMDCLSCLPERLSTDLGSYKDLDRRDEYELPIYEESHASQDMAPFRLNHQFSTRRIPKLVRQATSIEAPTDPSGAMKITFWL